MLQSHTTKRDAFLYNRYVFWYFYLYRFFFFIKEIGKYMGHMEHTFIIARYHN